MASAHVTLDEAMRVAVKDLAAASTEMRDALRQVVRVTTPEIRRLAESRAPVKTGTLQRSINVIFFDDGDVGSVYVRRVTDPQKGPGGTTRKRAPEFPLWIEYGTVTAPAKPFLIPAADQMKSVFLSRVAKAIEAVGQRHGA